MTEQNDKVKHPDTTYNTKYPYNKTYTTESGHTIEFDDSPGAERIRISHKSGTYTEVSADGRTVEVHHGEHRQYNKGGYSLTIDKSGDIKFSGHGRIVSSGDLKVECKGDMHASIAGDMIAAVKGGGILSIGKDLIASIKANLTAKISGSTNIKSEGSITMKTDGAMNLEASGAMQLRGNPINLN